MQVDELLNDGLKREYKVTVGEAELQDRIDIVLRDLRDRVPLKGFRPGKAPLKLLRQLHGEAAFKQIVGEAVNENVDRALREQQVRPALRPEVDLDEPVYGEALSFKMALEVLPELDVADFKAPALERLVATVDDADVDRYLKQLAEQQKVFTAADATYAAQEGDAVLIDFIGSIDGEAFDGGAGEDYELELGSQSFIEGFESQLIGAKAGEEKDLPVTFPESYHAEALAGKEAIFKVTVKEVRQPRDPEVDEELATNMGFESLEKLREVVVAEVEATNKEMARTWVKRKLLDALAEDYHFAVPETMVEMEYRSIWQQIRQEMVRAGELTNEEAAALEAPEDEKDVAEYRAIADRRVRLGLLLSEIGTTNGVQLTSEEISQRLIEEARKYPGQEQQVLKFLQENEQAQAQVRAPAFEDKVVDFILEMADVTDREVSRDELRDALEALDAEDGAEAATGDDVLPADQPVKKKTRKAAKAKPSPEPVDDSTAAAQVPGDDEAKA